MSLPNDISRCSGRERPARMLWGGDGGMGLEYEPLAPCGDCQRRTDPGEGPRISHMLPPKFIDGICPMRIAPDGGERGA